MTDPCIHELDPATCQDCTPHVDHDRKAEYARLKGLGWMPSQYGGKCADCGERYGKGELIRKAAFGWVSTCCLSE